MGASLALSRARLPWWVATGLLAGALKQHYSTAGAAELGWILRPVAILLEVATGHRFAVSAAGEWYSDAAGIVLAKGCAGINFMIMSFLGWCWLMRPPRTARVAGSTLPEWSLLFAMALLLAWAGAVLVNTLRILVAMAVGPTLAATLGADQAHRLLGLAIFLPALWAQLALGERRNPGPATLVAITIYVGLMLVTPLLTGRALAADSGYGPFALLVLALVAPVAGWAAVRAGRDARWRERHLDAGRTLDITRWPSGPRR